MDKAPGYTWAYSVVVDKMESKEDVVVDKLLCMSCLCVGRKLHTVKDQRMQQYYLQTLNEIPLCNMPQVCPNICWECMALLRKAVSFREQVKDSFRILQTYTNETFHECLLTDITRPPRMTVVSLDPVSILPSSAIDDDDKCSDDDKRCDDKSAALDVQQVYVKEEVKTEWSDVLEETDPTDDYRPPSDCKDSIEEEEIDIATLIRKKDKKKKKPPKQPEPQKILTIELSYEEMLVERASEATRESYLKAKHKCDTCLIGFTNIRSHESHMASKHSSELGDSSCPICKTVMPSVEAFTAHYKRHMRRYECSICHKRTMDMKVMQQHYYSAHEISLKEYKCNLCGKISNSIDTHRYHKDTHKARVECPDCDKTFTHRAGLMNHRLAVHELHNAFPCAECGKVFRWKTSLKRHLEKHDVKRSASSGAFCSVCEIAFSSVSSLQRHLRSSLKHVTTDDLRFICDHCNRRFADKTKLRDHIEEKHLHRTFQCPICLKPSKNRVGLDQHIRNVHKGRPNNKICHHCGKGFPTRVQLESHIRTHTGERPFICEYCPTTFSQQSNLYKHFRQVHLNIKSKRYPLSKKTEPPPTERVPPSLHFSPERGFLL